MIDGFRYGFFGVSDISPWNSFAIVACFFILVSVVALRLLQKGYKLRN
jgi:ABC-2 type transport system permease protein